MRGAGYTDRQPADEPGVKTRLVPVEVILAPHGAQFVRRRASRWALSLVVSLTLAAGGLAAQGQEPEEGDASAAADELDEDLLRWLVLRRRWWNALPDAPAPPTVTAAASSSLLVAWTMPEDTVMPVTGYDVEYRPDGEALFATWMHAGAATSTTIGDSAPSTTHHVRVRAINDNGSGDWSEPGVGKTANAAPVFAEGGSTTRSLAENTPADRNVGQPVRATDAEGGLLTYGLEGPDAVNFAILASTGQLRTRVGVVYDHEAVARYEVTVTVEDDQGGGASIAVAVDVSDLAEPPGRPAAPSVRSASVSSLRASWTAPVNSGPPVTDYDYRHRVSASGGEWVETVNSVILGTETVITGLTPGTSYEVQVRARSNEGTGAWSPSGHGATPATNRPPSFSEGASTSRQVAENTPAGSNIGMPVAANDPDGNTLAYDLEGTDAASFAIDSTSGQLRTAEGVSYDYESDSSHAVVVTAADGSGGTTSIAVTIGVTDRLEPPEQPSAPTVSAAGRGRLDVRWTAPENTGRPPISGYDLRYRAGGEFIAWPHAVATTNTTLTGLANGTYAVQVRARNDEGMSEWSASGEGTASNNSAPVVDEGKLDDLAMTVGGAVEVVPLQDVFSDPDGDTLTLGVSSNDETVVIAKLAGAAVSVDAGAPGSAWVTMTATDPEGATVAGAFKVNVFTATLPDPGLSVGASNRILTVSITDSFAPREGRAYRIRIRQKSPLGGWHGYCATVISRLDTPATALIEAPIPIGDFALPETVYEVDYRYLGASCTDATTMPSPWSRVAEVETGPDPGGGFNIDLVFASPEPSALAKSAINAAAAIRGQVITSDLSDIDFSVEPASNDCTDGDFAGVVDDLRILVQVRSFDGIGGTLADARICAVRLARISHQAASRRQKSSWFQEVDRDANDRAGCRLRWPCPRGSFGPVYTRAVRAHAPSTVGPAMLSVASTRTCPCVHRAKILRDHHGPW